MTERCNDCAFTHGTDASNSPHTVVIANMCAITGEPFWCHVKAQACAGWAEARAERLASPNKPTGSSKASADMLCQLVTECVRLAKIEDDQNGKRPDDGGATIICELCHGKGERLIAWPIGTPAKMKQCSDCEGSGKLNADGTPFESTPNDSAASEYRL